MAERGEIVTMVKQIIIDILGWDKTPDDFLGKDIPGETHMDSTQALDVILGLEEEYDITVEDEEVTEGLFASVDALADFVVKKLADQ